MLRSHSGVARSGHRQARSALLLQLDRPRPSSAGSLWWFDSRAAVSSQDKRGALVKRLVRVAMPRWSSNPLDYVASWSESPTIETWAVDPVTGGEKVVEFLIDGLRGLGACTR